jgi:hypothetical protein
LFKTLLSWPGNAPTVWIWSATLAIEQPGELVEHTASDIINVWF